MKSGRRESAALFLSEALGRIKGTELSQKLTFLSRPLLSLIECVQSRIIIVDDCR